MQPTNPEKDLFDQAQDLASPEDREAFVRRACGTDSVLAKRVLALLAAHEAATEFLPGNPVRTIPAGPEDVPGGEPGTVIGRYKLLERVGEGGCGVVYVAEQTEPVRRRVALKVIKLGMDTKSVVARFEAERQALAMMDHPNIAKVLDAGATDRGSPYFVMELVRGIPITQYCDQNSLGTPSRLNLFIQVCHAIQHAHQKGIIHRDIKPSNILVTVNDGVPVPKVIDFGIAKATEGRLTDNTIYTQLHQFIGTPAYMSPEQAEMTSLDIDTRSDIYSLGVLLYELLAGKTPFDARELMAAGLDAMRRTIREQEPARPSTKLGTLQGEELSTTAKRRATEAPKLLRQLQGDLDWITMKCLEKDRTRRYETANGLAADLLRHLSNEPVIARPPSPGYRFQKAFHRNKAAFAGAALIAVVLLGATAFSLRQAHLARRAAANERAARQESDGFAQFLTEAFRSPDPGRDGRGITVAEVLSTAAKKLETTLTNQPARRAAMQTALAETYLGLSVFPEAVPLLEQALKYHRTASGTEHTNTLHVMRMLSQAYGGVARADEALALLEELRTLRARVQGPEHPETLEAMTDLAGAYERSALFRPEHSRRRIELLQEVAAIRRRVLGPDHLETKRALLLAERADPFSDDREKSVLLAAEILEQVRREKGREHPEAIDALDDLIYHTPLHRHADKLRLSQEAIALMRRVYGPEHSRTLGCLNNLSYWQTNAGMTNEAIQTMEEILPLCRKTFGANHPTTLDHQAKLASDYANANRYEDAVCLAEQTWEEIRKSPHREEHASALNELADIYLRTPNGVRRTEAITLLQEAIGILRETRTTNAYSARILQTLSGALNAAERYAEAAAVLDELAPILSQSYSHPSGEYSRESARYASAQYQLGRAYIAARQPAKAVEPLETARARLRKLYPEPNASAADGLLAVAYCQSGQRAKGHEVLELASRREPPQPMAAMILAALQLLEGDTAGYVETRNRVLDWVNAHSVTNREMCEWYGKLASLQAGAPEPARTAALALARQSLDLSHGHLYERWNHLAVGMAEFRMGHYADADVALDEAARTPPAKMPWNHTTLANTAGFYRAMSLFQQGRAGEARERFQQAQATTKAAPQAGKDLLAPGADYNDLILWLAQREARGLLQISTSNSQ